MYDLVNFMCIDLEMSQPSKKIIQLGACVIDIRTGLIIDKLNVFINPNEQLSQYIKDLTKISQEQVDNGVTLENAYTQLKSMHLKHNCFRNLVQWGHGDSELLKSQLALDGETFVGGRRSIDVKTLYQAWRTSQNKPLQGGLANSMTKLGLKFEGQKHSAIDDAVNTALTYRCLLGKFKA